MANHRACPVDLPRFPQALGCPSGPPGPVVNRIRDSGKRGSPSLRGDFPSRNPQAVEALQGSRGPCSLAVSRDGSRRGYRVRPWPILGPGCNRRAVQPARGSEWNTAPGASPGSVWLSWGPGRALVADQAATPGQLARSRKDDPGPGASRPVRIALELLARSAKKGPLADPGGLRSIHGEAG